MIMIWRNLFATVAVLLCGSVLLQGAAESESWPFEQSDLSPDASVVFGELENGLRYAIMPNQEPRGRVSLRLFVRAGSLQEREDQRGLAHYLEHMAFNGTENFEAGTLVEYFQNLGMSFGADTNAYTGFDRTVYQIELPDNDRSSVDEALLVLRDFVDRMLIEEEEVESERGVILSEKRSRDSVRFRTALEEFAFLLPDSIIPDRFPIGAREVLESAGREDLLDFFESWYRPERTGIVIVGEVDPEDVEPLIEEQFGGFEAKRPEPDEPELGRVAARDGAARLHSETEASTTRVAIQSVQAYEPRPDTSAHRLEKLKRSVAMQMLNRRLDVLAQEEGAPFSRASVAAYDLFDFFTNASVELHSRPGDWEEALETGERELRRALDFGFREGELREVRANLINSFEEAARQAPTRRSRDLAEGLVASFSGNTVFTDPHSELALMKPALENLTVEACREALREAFPEGNRFFFVAGNVEFPDPEETILAVYRKSAATEVEPPEAFEDVAFAYDSFGAPGSVAERKHIEDLDIHQLAFENGVRLNLKQTDFSSNEVRLAVRLGGGRLTEPEEQPGLALLASETFIRGGLGEHSSDQLRRIFAGRNVGWRFSVSDDAFSFRGTTTPDDLEAQLHLLAAYIADPGYRDEALRRARDRFDEVYTEASHTAGGVLRDRVARFLAGDDYRFGLPPKEAVLELDLGDVRSWLEKPLDSGYLEISLVGDFGDPDAVVEKVAATLGALPERASEKEELSGKRVVSKPEGGREKRFEFESRIPSAVAAVYWPTTDMWDIERNRRLSVLSRVFSDRMRVRIREEMGEAYSPRAVSDTSDTYRDYGWFFGFVGVDPEKADEVAAVVVEIAGELHGGEISESELQRALRPVLTSLRDTVRENSYWINSVLASSQEYPQRLEWARRMSEDFESITAGDLESLARDYLHPDQALRVLVIPVDAEGEVLEPDEGGVPAESVY